MTEKEQSNFPDHSPLVQRPLTPAAQRALKEAEERRRKMSDETRPKEIGGRDGPDPVRFGDWEKGGIASDF
ncbi:DUF1674 domain-containing protein [Leptospira interrogans]